MNREPAIWTGLVVALLGVLLRWLDLPALDGDTAEAVATAVLTVGGALLVRANVMPVATIKAAGLDPAQVKEDADAPPPSVPAVPIFNPPPGVETGPPPSKSPDPRIGRHE